MGTLYINQDDAFIGKTDERLVVKVNNKILRDVPLIHLEAIVILGRATVSPAAIAELLKHKIPLTFISDRGEYLGTLEPELTKNIFVRDAQWKAAGETPKAIHAVRGFIRGKLKIIGLLCLKHSAIILNSSWNQQSPKLLTRSPNSTKQTMSTPCGDWKVLEVQLISEFSTN